jgi:hypothetical protein
VKAKRAIRKSKSQKPKSVSLKKITSRTRGLKKNNETESLLNTLARGVGRAAGTIARATRQIAASGEALASEKLGKSAAKPRRRSELPSQHYAELPKERPHKKGTKARTASGKSRTLKARILPR